MGITAKKQLFFEIEQLSGRYLAELEKFVQYLKFRQAGEESLADNERRGLRPEADPILGIIGTIDAEPFAEDIDDTLYLDAEQQGLLDLLNSTIDSGRGDFAEQHDHYLYGS